MTDRVYIWVLCFYPSKATKLVASFDAGVITSNAGALLLGQPIMPSGCPNALPGDATLDRQAVAHKLG